MYITSFVSTGPKCYSLKKFDPSQNKFFEQTKCKGFSLNGHTKDLINFKGLKSLIVDDTEKISITYPKKIQRNEFFQVTSSCQDKRLPI